MRYMKIKDGTVVCAPDPDDPYLKSAEWFETNSTSRLDVKQRPEPCFIRTIIGIHCDPPSIARRPAAGGGRP